MIQVCSSRFIISPFTLAEFYDRPSNNLSIISGLNTFGYSYTTAPPVAGARSSGSTVVVLPAIAEQTSQSTAIYAVVPRIKFADARKQSLEHIYDEIKYADRQPAATMDNNLPAQR